MDAKGGMCVKQVLNWPLVRFLHEIVDIYFSKRVSRSAAELAYFLILTFFPILICVNAFIGLLHLDIGAVLQAADDLLPRESLSILADYLAYISINQSRGLLVAGIMTTLFAASAAFRSLMNIMDDIYDRRSYQGVRQIIASVVFSVLMLITIYLSIVVVFTGEWLFQLLARLLRLEEWCLPWTWQWLRFLLLFCLVMVFISLVYRMSAPIGKPRPPVLRGAILAAAALVGASALFSWFIGMSSR